MKKLFILINSLWLAITVYSQSNVLYNDTYLNAFTQYLISTNGKYKFYNVEKVNDPNGNRFWVLKNTQTGEELFHSQGMFMPGDAKYPGVRFQRAWPFTAVSCSFGTSGELCQNIDFTKPPVSAPVLFTEYWEYYDQEDHRSGFQDPIGIASAIQVDGSDYMRALEVFVPGNEEVFVKDMSTGIYSIPIEKQARCLKVLDDGNMVILNYNNQILWETGTGEQQLIDTRLNKKIKDVTANFSSGLGLLAQGNVQLINTNITQDVANVVLIAHAYVEILPGTGKSSLNATGGKGSVELKCIPGAPVVLSRKNDAGTGAINGAVLYNETPGSFFKAFPNPTAGMIKFSTAINEKILYINIVDITGRYNLQRYADTDKADLSGLAQGVYIYKVVTDKGTYSGKLVKQ